MSQLGIVQLSWFCCCGWILHASSCWDIEQLFTEHMQQQGGWGLSILFCILPIETEFWLFIYACASNVASLIGTTALHIELEEQVASFIRKPAAIVFGMGYVTNSAILPVLTGKVCKKGSVILILWEMLIVYFGMISYWCFYIFTGKSYNQRFVEPQLNC